MNTILYCFSATGNSLTTARLLSQALDEGCSLSSLPSLREEKHISVCADAVGFVFPVYYSDISHLCAICTSRVHPTISLYTPAAAITAASRSSWTHCCAPAVRPARSHARQQSSEHAEADIVVPAA